MGRLLRLPGCLVYYAPEWLNMSDIADTIRRSRLVITDAQEVRLTSFECRDRAAVLRGEAQSLRAERLAHSIRG